jgi:hypothetical protein
MSRRRGEPFTFGYPKGHQPMSVAAVPLSQLADRHWLPVPGECEDRRWSGEPMPWWESRPAAWWVGRTRR